jgi:histidinol-phosphate aminotransferase
MSTSSKTTTGSDRPQSADTVAVPGTATRRAWMKSGGAALAALALRPAVGLPQSAATEVPGTTAARVRARLSLNENPFGCSPLAAEAIRSHLGGLNRYTEREAEALTAQIAAKESVAPEQIVLGEILPALGTQLGLVGGPGGEFIYSTPGFTDLVAAELQTGGTAIAIPLNDRQENDLPALSARISARTRAVYIVNPHNPSGTITDADTLKSFVRDVSRRTLVIIDEAYLELTDAFAGRTLAPLVRTGHNVAVFRTFGKVYGLAALQFGYTVAPAALASTLHQQGIGATHGLNRLAVTAASAALRDTRFVDETRRKITVERARWNAALDGLGLRRSESQGNFVFFQSGRPHEEVAAAFLSEGIQIGRSFPPLDRWARISIGLPEENALAIDVLRKVLRN